MFRNVTSVVIFFGESAFFNIFAAAEGWHEGGGIFCNTLIYKQKWRHGNFTLKNMIFPNVFLCTFAVGKTNVKQTKKQNTTMKRFIFPALAAVVVALTAASCTRDTVMIQSMHTKYAEFTVTNGMWEPDANEDLVASLQWDLISAGILTSGNVQAYLYEGARQVPLPYVYPVTFVDDAGNEFVRPLNVRFDLEEGISSFIITDCGEFLTDPVTLKTMRFRAVCTYPVYYELEQ